MKSNEIKIYGFLLIFLCFFSLTKILVSEDDFNQKYEVYIPPQNPSITADDIAVFLFTDYFVLWVRKTAKNIASQRFYDRLKHNFSDMRSLNVERDYEVWENLVQPIKNGTLPSISKKRGIDNSYVVTISYPKQAVDKERFLSIHKLYREAKDDDPAIRAKVDYRMKLPANPHYVRRTLHKNDGTALDVFTVADEGSEYIKEMKAAIDSNSSELLQNNTVSVQNNYLSKMDLNYTLLNLDNPPNNAQNIIFEPNKSE